MEDDHDCGGKRGRAENERIHSFHQVVSKHPHQVTKSRREIVCFPRVVVGIMDYVGLKISMSDALI